MIENTCRLIPTFLLVDGKYYSWSDYCYNTISLCSEVQLISSIVWDAEILKASSTLTQSVTKNKFTKVVAKFIPVTKSMA